MRNFKLHQGIRSFFGKQNRRKESLNGSGMAEKKVCVISHPTRRSPSDSIHALLPHPVKQGTPCGEAGPETPQT